MRNLVLVLLENNINFFSLSLALLSNKLECLYLATFFCLFESKAGVTRVEHLNVPQLYRWSKFTNIFRTLDRFIIANNL